MRSLIAWCALLCGCSEVLVVPNDGDGGGGATSTDTTTVATNVTSSGQGGDEPQVGSGGAGGGPAPKDRMIVVDADIPSHADPEEVIVLVSGPDGTVSDWWTGAELPVDAGVNDGDLVTFAYLLGPLSRASSYRVTPAVMTVRADVPIPSYYLPCREQAPMNVTLVLPEVAGANTYNVETSSGVVGLYSLGPGTSEREIRACEGIESFDVVALASEFTNLDAFAFARVDAVPYVPGSSVELPIVWSTERQNVDIVVSGAPGTSLSATGAWRDDSLSFSGMYASASITAQIGQGGTTNLTYGPLAIGGGRSSVSVSTPPIFTCEMDNAWRITPFDGTPFVVAFGTLAGFAPTADGNVAIGGAGEVGDVLHRFEDDYLADEPASWQLLEDPLTPYPLPTHPDLPAGTLPDFKWPSAAAEILHVHQDLVGIEGYTQYASINPAGLDGRMRRRSPQSCF